MTSAAEETSNTGHRLDHWLKLVTALRDGLLVAVPFVYVVGYLVWSFNAFQNHLGMLPALDPQYFVAGLIPVVIVMAAYFGGKYFKRFLINKWPELVGYDAKGFWRFIRTALLIAFWATLALLALGPPAAAFALFVYITYKVAQRYFPNILEIDEKASMSAVRSVVLLLIVAVFLVLLWKRNYLSQVIFSRYSEALYSLMGIALAISVTLLPPMEDKFLSWISRLYRWLWVYLGVLFFVVLGLAFYLESVYPRFPQEFGGVRPRCAYLDVVKSQVSTETLQSIAPAGVTASSPNVVRSSKIEILYSGSNVVLIRSQGKVYEIAKGVIQTVSPCD